MVTLSRFFVLFFFSASLLAGCADLGTAGQPVSDEVSVTKIGGEDGKQPLKRRQLESEVMRYADRYQARMALEADTIRAKATTAEQRWFALGWKLACQTAVVEIAIGPNAVENLLDMIVLASLTREEVETYWAPEFLGEDLGQRLLKASRQLEEEIWEGSKVVLTPEQQKDLRELIHEWNEKHPDQHYFWGVRFSGFTDQRAAQIQQVQQSGGLLGEIAQTREAAIEIEAFGERVLYYMNRAPNLTRLQAQFGLQEVLNMPEVTQVLNDTNRVTRSTERYAAVLEKLPADLKVVITHMFDELKQEREEAINQLMKQQQETLTGIIASKELVGAVDRIGEESQEITNTAFIRGLLLVLVWGVVFVIGRVIADKFRIRYQHKLPKIE